MAKIKLSVIIPAYNEAQRIVPTIVSVKQYFTREKIAGEIIVVDDGSTDATGLAVTGLVDQYIKLPVNQGKGAAVRKGMFAAKGEDILMMDADGSTSITAYEDLIKGRKGADIVIGSRHLEGSVIHIKQSLVRQAISYMGSLVFRVVLGLPFADNQCGFKLFSRQSAHDIFAQTVIDRWGFDVEALTIARILGYKVSEVPVEWHDSRGSSLRAGRAVIYTVEEVAAIWLNIRMGKYKKIKKPKSSR